MAGSGANIRKLRAAKAGAVGVLILLACAGLAVAATRDSSSVTYHGCVHRTTGLLRVIDPSQGESCRPNERGISFNETGPAGPPGLKGDTGAPGPQGVKGDTGAPGPQGVKGDTGAPGPQGVKGDTGATGPQGPQGDTGPQGPQGQPGAAGPAGVTSLQSLSGTTCTRADGTAGAVAVSVSSDNSISISCGPKEAWCETHTPAVGPHMSVTCNDAAQQLTYTCDSGWVDTNHDPADGCETSAELQPISFSGSAANLLAFFIFQGVDTVQVQPDCGSALVAACTGGTPSSQLPTMTADLNPRAGDLPRVQVVPDATDSRYNVTVRFRLRTDAAIPITVPLGGTCGLNVDTTAGVVPDVSLSFHDNVVAPDGPTVVSDVTMSGLEFADYSITGGFACGVAGGVTLTSLVDVLVHTLTPWAAQRGVFCGASEPAYFQTCPAQP
jgi:hypothetical protein